MEKAKIKSKDYQISKKNKNNKHITKKLMNKYEATFFLSFISRALIRWNLRIYIKISIPNAK